MPAGNVVINAEFLEWVMRIRKLQFDIITCTQVLYQVDMYDRLERAGFFEAAPRPPKASGAAIKQVASVVPVSPSVGSSKY